MTVNGKVLGYVFLFQRGSRCKRKEKQEMLNVQEKEESVGEALKRKGGNWQRNLSSQFRCELPLTCQL